MIAIFWCSTDGSSRKLSRKGIEDEDIIIWSRWQKNKTYYKNPFTFIGDVTIFRPVSYTGRWVEDFVQSTMEGSILFYKT